MKESFINETNINENINLYETDINGNNAIQRTITSGQEYEVLSLLTYIADLVDEGSLLEQEVSYLINHPNSNGSTSLHLALAFEMHAVAITLLDNFQPDINLTDNHGWSSYNLAIISQNQRVIELMESFYIPNSIDNEIISQATSTDVNLHHAYQLYVYHEDINPLPTTTPLSGNIYNLQGQELAYNNGYPDFTSI